VPETLRAYKADPYSFEEARALSAELGLSEPVAIALVRRGYRTPEQARTFLAADETHSPDAFEAMAAVVEAVLAAVEEGRRITVHGDFDVDGVCATTILVSTLREIEADCDWLIPDRLTDGYGLSEENVRKLAERGTGLILTADCGITAVAEVALAEELGMSVVVTDHHQAGAELPDCPILHPGLDDGYPFDELCGTAVAWKLATALRGTVGMGSSKRSAGASLECFEDPIPTASADVTDLDLVALATVADLVPLVGENRALVRRGVEEVRRAQRPGMRALIEAAKCEPTQLDESDLGFKLAPRINAAGRLYRADAGVELFLTDDEERAAEIANELSRANGERRATEREVAFAAEAALRELPQDLREASGLVVAGEGWHPGVIGIVASRLVEKHHRPVVVISLEADGSGRGSGRSIPGFNLLAGLEACAEHLGSFGGHKAAAGLELKAGSLDAFRDAFAAHAGGVLGPEDLVRTERIDAMVGGATLGLDLAEELRQLAPFGMGNPGIRLLVPGARVRDVRTMGEEGKHARFNLHSGSHKALGVAFGRSSLGIGEDDQVDVAVRLEVNQWNGAVEPRVVLRELYRREAAAAELAAVEWWGRFEVELARDPAEWGASEVAAGGAHARETCRSGNAPAAVLGELASAGNEVLALAADAALRAGMSREGVRVADYAEVEREPGLAAGFGHVVLVDPPASSGLLALVGRAEREGCYLHCVWGDAEWRFALSSLAVQLVQRQALIAAFRDLREAGEIAGEDLRDALVGSAPQPRSAETAARCFRVFSELELVRGKPTASGEPVGVVSSKETDLERSASYRAYSARYEEARQYLEAHKQP
jgi:single-stranded-DNA-specific exonuclease